MSRCGLHLRRRHDAIYFRRRIPAALVELMGRTEINVQLPAARLSDVRDMATRMRVACDMMVRAYRMGWYSKSDKADVVIWEFYNQISRAAEEVRIGDGLRNPYAVDQFFFDETPAADVALSLRQVGAMAHHARSLLAMHDLKFDENSDEFVALCLDLARALKRAEVDHVRPGSPLSHASNVLTDEELAQLRKKFGKGSDLPTEPATTPENSEAKVQRVTLVDAVRAYRADIEISQKVELKTLAERLRDLDLLVEIAGNGRTVDAMSRSLVREMRDLIVRLPPRFRNAKEDRDRSLVEIAAENKSDSRLSPASVNKMLSNVMVFAAWASREYGIPDIDAGDLKIENSRAIDEGRRAPFTPAHLKTIFDAPLYRGCVSESCWWEAGSTSMWHTGRYWMPLLGLYSGARLEELAGLAIEDIDIPGRRLHIRRNEHRENIKSAAARRWVPIHTELERLGFYEFVSLGGSLATWYRQKAGLTARHIPSFLAGSWAALG